MAIGLMIWQKPVIRQLKPGSGAVDSQVITKLILKLSQNSHNDEILNENKPANENWLGEMGKSSGTPTQTLYRWWDNFCKETGLTDRLRECHRLD